jgi:hypothetical protein
MEAMAAADYRLQAGARLDPVSLRLALRQERVERLRACLVNRRRHRATRVAGARRVCFRNARGTTRPPRGSCRFDRRFARALRRAGRTRTPSGEARALAYGRDAGGGFAAAFPAWPRSRRANSRPSTPRRSARSTVRASGGSRPPGARSTGFERRRSRPTIVLPQLGELDLFVPVRRATLGGEGALCFLRSLPLTALLDRELARSLRVCLLLLRRHPLLLPLGRAPAAASSECHS